MTVQEAYNLLLDVGMDPSLAGFQYWIAAIKKGAKDEGYCSKGMTTRLYPELAEEFNKSIRVIEKAMRYAVSRLLATVDPDILYKYFGNSPNFYTGRISNKMFLSGMVYCWIYEYEGEKE